MIINHRHFKGLGKEPGEQSHPDPVHPEDYCEEKDCEHYDWDTGKCREGRDPRDCIDEAMMDEDTRGDIEYHRRVDEGEM